MTSMSTRRGPEIPRGEAAADVDLGHVAVTDQLETALAGGAVRRDPVADFRGTVADGRQALVEEIDQLALVARLEVTDALAVEGFVDLAHGGLADRMRKPAGR